MKTTNWIHNLMLYVSVMYMDKDAIINISNTLYQGCSNLYGQSHILVGFWPEHKLFDLKIKNMVVPNCTNPVSYLEII